MNHNFTKEGIDLPLSYISITNKWQEYHLNDLKTSLDQIDTRTHHEFKTDKISFVMNVLILEEMKRKLYVPINLKDNKKYENIFILFCRN